MKTVKKINYIPVREYALLLKGGNSCEIDCCSIPDSAFNWLLEHGHSTHEEQRDLIRVKRYQSGVALQVINYVGVLETPCGTRIEILPKICHSTDSKDAKKILLKMLETVFKLSLQQFHQSKLQILKRPLFEILISQFLKELSTLVKRGIRSNYQRIKDRSLYLKGSLEVSKQIRQRPGSNNYLHISYEKYLPDRPENRLIYSSLIQVLKWTKSNENKRLGQRLLQVLEGMQCSGNYKYDFKKWSNDRSLAHYKNIKSWCKLILSYHSPMSLSGNEKGISFLFPMEQLFERYVAIKLRQALQQSANPFTLKEQHSTHSLLTHKDNPLFRLRPDIVITNKSKTICVADTKWKLINEFSDIKCKYGVQQADLYQMFAYGNKCMDGTGYLYLIYPQHKNFPEKLEPFYYTEKLKLFIIPFDLDTDSCALIDNLQKNIPVA